MKSFAARTALVCIALIGLPWAGTAIGNALVGPTDTTGNGREGEARPLPVVTDPTPAARLVSPRPRASVASRSRPSTVSKAISASGTRLNVTAYCWTGNRTASGVYPEVGMAAGNAWPFGTRLRVEGLGVVTVADRYGAGTQLDIYLGRDGCEQRARDFGRRHLLVEVVR